MYSIITGSVLVGSRRVMSLLTISNSVDLYNIKIKIQLEDFILINSKTINLIIDSDETKIG